MQKIRLTTWLMKGTYPRLFAPILLIIVLVLGIRYHILIENEANEVQALFVAELGHTGLAILPALVQISTSDREAIERLLRERALREMPSLQVVRWQVEGGEVVEIQQPRLPASAPDFLFDYLHLVSPERTFTATLPQGQRASLTLTVQIAPLVDRIWHATLVQARLSALNVFIILFLLTLILRANERMLQRLAAATDQFKRGELSARMQVTGTLESRAVANTFNAMAEKIHLLVHSLHESQRQKDEQLHFTRQLIDSLPLPVSVVNAHHVCLDINKAWETAFEVNASQCVGRRSNFINTTASSLPISPSFLDIQVATPSTGVRDMTYIQAPFTTANGVTAGIICTLIDITDKKQAENALKLEKERAQITLASIGDGVITTDANGRIETINSAAQLMTGHDAPKAIGRPIDDVLRLFEEPISLTTPSGFGQELSASTPHQATQQILIHRSGEHYAIEYTAAPILTDGGESSGCVLVFRDVTETRELREKLSWHARHDPLTGLHNRVALAERLTHAIFSAQKENMLLAVCIIDLDYFHAINERYGVGIGNRLIKEVSLRLKTCVTQYDAVARMGGDEFALLFGFQSDIAAIKSRTLQVLSHISQPYAIDNLVLNITASIGIAIFPQDNVNPDTLLRHADQAMCLAKRTGRNQIHLFDAQHDIEVQTLHSQQTRIAQALHRQEFRLFYQPKINLRTNDIIGMEALLRWQHPEQGIIGPQHVFPLIDDTDLIIEVGEWVLEQALQQLRKWNSAGLQWTVSVNIAAWHFYRPNFVERLRTILQTCPDVSPSQLELEILESSAFEDMAYMQSLMQSCQALGVHFALDDFGTGFSSLSYLKCLPAETIKIDQSFVKGLLDNQDDLTLVTAIIALGTALHRNVVAEGAETSVHCAQLLKLGCEFAQGYGIARPMPADQVISWAKEYRHQTLTQGELSESRELQT